jgi:hypothetical protein
MCHEARKGVVRWKYETRLIVEESYPILGITVCKNSDAINVFHLWLHRCALAVRCKSLAKTVRCKDAKNAKVHPRTEL